MNEVHLTVAAAVVIPSVIAAGIFIMPSEEDRQAKQVQTNLENLKKNKESKTAGIFSNDDDKMHLVVLQPFVVSGGVFTVHLEAIGDDSRSALCTNLPIVHDAVLTELHHAIEDPAMQPPGENLKLYADAVRHQINEAFDKKVVTTVVLAYADVQSFNANAYRMQTGSSKRCITSKT